MPSPFSSAVPAGLFSTFRNPSAHAPRVLLATPRSDALYVLTLISMLHRRLDSAVVALEVRAY
ncbi:TIGR02391 family protein [Nonomuraea guangzhouensis]|uniref:TIGR02391 family protein n=1 Tax=Nonomuraea guangzhouensis TaxID=1291555 RepID=A0ABW4GTR2_9ACTN